MCVSLSVYFKKYCRYRLQGWFWLSLVIFAGRLFRPLTISTHDSEYWTWPLHNWHVGMCVC